MTAFAGGRSLFGVIEAEPTSLLQLPDGAALIPPAVADPDRAFDEPWQARVFALVVELNRRGVLDWGDWAGRLGAAIAQADAMAADQQPGYHGAWLSAFEGWLDEQGLLPPAPAD